MEDPQGKMGWPDSKKKEIVLRVIEHLKTVKIEAACQMEGINLANYYHWRKKFDIVKEPFDVVSKPKQLVPELIEKIVEQTLTGIIFIQHKDGTIHQRIIGDEKDYSYMQSMIGLKALRVFNKEIK